MVQAKLLDIAVAEFGAKGLAGASTRGIAAAAGTAMSSITYHYGGKDGLYEAAADHIAATMRADMAAVVEQGRAALGAGPDAARRAVHAAVGRMADKMSSAAYDSSALFIVREQTRPTPAFDRLYNGCMGGLMEMLGELVCVATGAADRNAARIAAVTILGQAMALRSARASCLRLLDVPELSGILDEIKRRLAANTDAILDRMAAEARGTA
jgi:TetR/AcrR family transcriptional regulator, regulator of cefoperazone and chloramphenicol sensitivity